MGLAAEINGQIFDLTKLGFNQLGMGSFTSGIVIVSKDDLQAEIPHTKLMPPIFKLVW